MSDDGAGDPRLRSALEDPRHRGELLAALIDARVFAAISATSTREHLTEHGLRAESTAEMAVLLLATPDGSQALPVFSDLGALQQWNLTARPVPLTGRQACQAVLDEGGHALVLDPAGPGVLLHEADVRALAAGWVPVTGSVLASRLEATTLVAPSAAVPPALVQALATALVPERLRGARLLQSPEGLVLGVSPREPLSPAALAGLAQRVLTRLGEALPSEGLALAEVPPRGPGIPVVRQGRFRRG